MHSFTVRVDKPLELAFDPAERLRSMPADARLKGMFFSRMTGLVKDQWVELERTLDAPPRLGTYVPFAGYPMRDYGRLTIAAARAAHPRAPLAEGIRLVEREAARAFADSTIGGVMLRIIDDLESAMLKIPDVQRMVYGRGKVSATREAPRHVRMEFEGIGTWVDCSVVGNLEGAVMMYRETPTIEVEVHRADRHVLHVRW